MGVLYTPVMSSLIYRAAGFLSGKSLIYIDQLENAGWDPTYLESFATDLIRFESASVKRGYDEALLTFMPPPHEVHTPYLTGLNAYIRAISDAAVIDTLQGIATDTKVSNKDGMAARSMLLHFDAGDIIPTTEIDGKTVINFNVKPAKGEVKVTHGK